MKRVSSRAIVGSLPLVAVAFACGAALALAYPPVSVGVVSLVALIPVLVFTLRRERTPRQFFWTGYFFGVGFFFFHLNWIVDLLPASSITLPWIMVPALLLLVAYLSVYPALAFWLTRKLSRGQTAIALLVFPALWTLIEVLRSSGVLGFPWGAMGYSTVRLPALMQSASVVGVFGVGAGIVAVNALLAGTFLARDARIKIALFAAGTAIAAGAFLGGRVVMQRYDVPDGRPTHRVAVAQPNVDLEVKWQKSFKDSTFRLIERLTREAGQFDPELVVFPETCATTYLRFDQPRYELMQNLARELDLAVYIGFLDARYEDGRDDPFTYNSSGVFLPNGGFAQYDKRHLLPFGETIPWSWRFPFLSKINFGQANFSPGPDHGAVPSPVGDLAPLICFEAIFAGGAREFVGRGAQVLLNITNDGWFGESQGPQQHAELAIFRAVENRRFMLRSANTGVSMVIDPAGRQTILLGLLREGIITESIYQVEEVTLYTRWGDTPVVIVSLLVSLAGGVLAYFRRA